MIGLSKHINLLKENDAVHFLFDGVMDMKIREVDKNKKQFISLLLLADEQENMIDRYIENDIVNIGLHFFLKDVRPMLPPVMNRSIVDA